MKFYIFNKDLELKGILDVFTSFCTTRRYHGVGNFELQCSLNSKTLKLLKRDNILYKKGDETGYYIENVHFQINENGQELITVSGKDLIGYFARRIIWNRIDFTGKAENLMRKLISENAINPVDTKRKIPHLIMGDVKNFTENISYQNSFGNLLEQLQFISNTSQLGIRNIFHIKQKNIIFDVYKGVDRTINNGEIAPCIFSRDFENILSQEYFDSTSNYKNTYLIAGAGEDENRKLTSIENGEGLNRHELYVDARDISDSKDENVIIPTQEYNELLKQRGYEKLSEYKEIQTLDSKININGNNKYKVDFDLGDVVTVIDKKWGIKINVRITEIEEIYEASGINININFGNHIPTLIDKIKQLK